MNTISECVYGFNKDNRFEGSEAAENTSNTKHCKTSKTHKIDKSPKGSIVYRSKYFYPFFGNSINDKLLSSQAYGELSLSQRFKRNEITKLNKFVSPLNNIEDALALLPPSKETALSQVETYFDSVHPIIPILKKSSIIDALVTTGGNHNNQENINAPKLLLIMALFFCSSYAAVASGVIPDLLLCNKYYAAYRFLLDTCEFPLRPNIESLMAFTVVNFVIDPNMVDAMAYSSMLVRMGQQLGLHKMDDIQSKLLWGYLLYIEGSASVVSGFSYFTPGNLITETASPSLDSMDQNGMSAAYTIGRYKVNAVFRDVMDLSTRQSISQDEFQLTQRKVEKLYDEILHINSILKIEFPVYGSYFASTSLVFLYRLHLRHTAFFHWQFHKDKLLQKTDNQINSAQPLDITSSLISRHTYGADVIYLAVLLLFYTYERLVQENTAKFTWYTRGSTVMQYLFIVIKDLYQNELKPCELNKFPEPLRRTIDANIEEILKKDKVFFKFVLIDHVIGLLELKLAALWNDEDLYKFILIKAIKEKVWQVFQEQLEQNKARLEELSKCDLFACGEKHLQNFKSINFEDYIGNWESDAVLLEMNKILISWLADLQGE